MKIKNTSVLNQNNIHLSQFKNKHKYQILENYWKEKKERMSKKNLSKNFAKPINYEIFIFLFN